jgi:hypothetical protein
MLLREDGARLLLHRKDYGAYMPNGMNKKRAAPISYRPPQSLREEFSARVQKSGLSTCGFITHSIFSTPPPRQSRRPSIEQKLLARLLNEAAKIHGDLQQFSSCEGGEVAAQIEAATEELAIIRTALLKAMGRNP